MPQVRFTAHLRRYFPTLTEGEVAGASVAEVVRSLDARYPGLAHYIVDDRGALRRHVNIFVGKDRVRDADTLSDPVGPSDVVSIIQALSGG